MKNMWVKIGGIMAGSWTMSNFSLDAFSTDPIGSSPLLIFAFVLFYSALSE
jgi:hypothetical protein